MEKTDTLNTTDRHPVPLAQWVSEVLADRIADGRYPEGHPLLENQLSHELGVSRSPIREALRVLERDGLVSHSPRRGTVVAGYTTKSIDDIYQCRTYLMSLAARLATPRLTEEDLRDLKSLLENMQRSNATHNVHEYLRANREFHDLLYTRSENEVLLELIAMLRRRVRRLRFASLTLPSRMTAALQTHHDLMQALEARDAEEAGKRAAEIIDGARRALLDSASLAGRDTYHPVEVR